MHIRNVYLAVTLVGLAIRLETYAQTTNSTPTSAFPTIAATDSSKALSDALKARGDTVDALLSGKTQIALVIGQLRIAGSPSGLKLEGNTDFALAATDIGQRLLAAGKTDQAEQFFREAEKALAAALKKTPDSAAHDKAMMLQAAAIIRARYLDEATQAKADIEAAVKLQPNDQYLAGLQTILAGDKAEIFKTTPKG